MAPVRKVHQVFFRFDDRLLDDYPTFAASRDAFAAMDGWEHRLWDEGAAESLMRERYPTLFDVYRGLRYPVQRVDFAKYAIADAHGGVVCDLDVLPKCHLDDIVVSPCLFDWCSRRNVIANDFFYTELGLPGIFDNFAANLARVEAIPVYARWKMRYVFHTTGPDFFTRYLKRTGLAHYAARLSARSFLDPRQKHREVASPGAKLDIVHQLSWLPQLRDADGRTGGEHGRSVDGRPQARSGAT